MKTETAVVIVVLAVGGLVAYSIWSRNNAASYNKSGIHANLSLEGAGKLITSIGGLFKGNSNGYTGSANTFDPYAGQYDSLTGQDF